MQTASRGSSVPIPSSAVGTADSPLPVSVADAIVLGEVYGSVTEVAQLIMTLEGTPSANTKAVIAMLTKRTKDLKKIRWSHFTDPSVGEVMRRPWASGINIKKDLVDKRKRKSSDCNAIEHPPPGTNGARLPPPSARRPPTATAIARPPARPRATACCPSPPPPSPSPTPPTPTQTPPTQRNATITPTPTPTHHRTVRRTHWAARCHRPCAVPNAGTHRGEAHTDARDHAGQ